MPRWTRALVTGASSGIGDAIARRLADDGTELVVVARDAERLEALAADLDVAVEVLPADLATKKGRAAVADRLGAEPAVDLLVNNAGFGQTGSFLDLNVKREADVVAVNSLAVMELTHAAARAMAPRGGGGVLNVSSMAGYMVGGGAGVYGATKAFVNSFSQAAHDDLKASGVTVTAVCPGFTRTEFQDRADYDASSVPDLMWQTADQVAAESLDAVGKGRALVTTGMGNKLMGGVARSMPSSVMRRVAGLLNR